MKLYAFPLVRLIIPFVIGIVVGITFSLPLPYFNWVLFFLFMFLVGISHYKSFFAAYKNQWLFGILVNLFMLFAGYQLVIYKAEIHNPNHFSKFIELGSSETILGEVIETPKVKVKSIQLVLGVNAIKRADSLVSKNGKLMMYIAKTKQSSLLKIGDLLVLKTRIKPIKPYPESDFDYAKYLSYKAIYHSGYSTEGSWIKLNENIRRSFTHSAQTIRDELLLSLKANGLDGTSYSIGSALLLGKKGDLDKNVLSSFSTAGIMHILAVSGLHVGILFLVFNSALFFLDKIKHGSLFKSAVIVLLLWCYAFITGMSPSVVRAVTMFSFVAFGNALNRKSYLINTLFVSLFCLLLFDPYMLCSVGFQLSYAAVFGIAIIYPWMYAKLGFDNLILDKAWAIICVSIAAQIGTFPLGIYYFDVFPTYFIISNLLVIPTVTIALIVGLISLFCIPFSGLCTLLIKLFTTIVGVLVAIAQLIESLPFSSIKGIDINEIQLALLIAVVALFFGFVKANEKVSRF